jgi:hypothetical protein
MAGDKTSFQPLTGLAERCRDEPMATAATIEVQRALIVRAAALLVQTKQPLTAGWLDHESDFWKERDQWLDDSGIGKFSQEAIKAAMDDNMDDE